MFGPVLPGPPEASQRPHFQVLGKQELILRKYLPKLQVTRNANTSKGVGKEGMEEGRAGGRKGAWLLFRGRCSLDFRKPHLNVHISWQKPAIYTSLGQTTHPFNMVWEKCYVTL